MTIPCSFSGISPEKWFESMLKTRVFSNRLLDYSDYSISNSHGKGVFAAQWSSAFPNESWEVEMDFSCFVKKMTPTIYQKSYLVNQPQSLMLTNTAWEEKKETPEANVSPQTKSPFESAGPEGVEPGQSPWVWTLVVFCPAPCGAVAPGCVEEGVAGPVFLGGFEHWQSSEKN